MEIKRGYEFLAMLEGKIRETPFFKVQSGKITVCSSSNVQAKTLGHPRHYTVADVDIGE